MKKGKVILDLYHELGHDYILSDSPVDRLKDEPALPLPENQSTATPDVGTRRIDRDAADRIQNGLHDADYSLVDGINSLTELHDAVDNFEGCDLKKTAMKTVFGDGDPDSDVVFIGEAPGAEEDKQGVPFCGQSGKLLDNILIAMGRDRKGVYITNTVFWRPPGNRRPTAEELSICKHFWRST